MHSLSRMFGWLALAVGELDGLDHPVTVIVKHAIPVRIARLYILSQPGRPSNLKEVPRVSHEWVVRAFACRHAP
jgi:hypothetical protein